MKKTPVHIKKYLYLVVASVIVTMILFGLVRYYSSEYKKIYSAELENLTAKRELVDIMQLNIIKLERNRFSLLKVSDKDDLQVLYKKLRTGLADVRQVYFLLKNGGVYMADNKTIEYEKVDDVRDDNEYMEIEMIYIQFLQYIDLIFQPDNSSKELPIEKQKGLFRVHDDNLQVFKQLDDLLFKLHESLERIKANTNNQFESLTLETDEKLAFVSQVETISYIIIFILFLFFVFSLFSRMKKISTERTNAMNAVKAYNQYISSVFDSMPIGVVVIENNEKIKQCNKYLRQFFPDINNEVLFNTIRREFLVPFNEYGKNELVHEVTVEINGKNVCFLGQKSNLSLADDDVKIYTFVDIERRKEIERHSVIQNEVFHELNIVSDEFMKSKEVSTKSIKQLLEAVGETLKVQRACHYKIIYDGGKPFFYLQNYWSDELSVEPDIKLENSSDELQFSLKRWFQLFENGLEVIAQYADLLPEEKTFYSNDSFSYICALPIFVNRNLDGFLTFDSREKESVLLQIDTSVTTAIRMTVEAMLERVSHDKMIKEKNNELLAYSEELEAQSDALKEQNIEMAFQQQKIEEVNKLKSEFITNMSHELRTPMNAIIGISKMLLKYNADNLTEKQTDGLGLITSSGQRLLSQINDILDLSKVDSGKMELKESWLMIDKLLSNIKNTYYSLANEKNIELIIIKDESFIEKIYTDESKLHNILTNLVGNALKFTEKGKIEIYSYLDKNRLYFEVKDTGIGIGKEHFNLIFEEFKQVDGSHTKKYPGTGLGLALAKKLVELLGGEITVASELGEGSCFTFFIPYNYEKSGIANDLLLKEVKNKDISSVRSKVEKIKMLIVEDDYNNLYLYSEYVSGLDYEIKYAKNGIEAMRFVEDNWPDIIILDLNIPKISGFEILEKLKSNEITMNIPVIVISATDDLSAMKTTGYFEYIKKPVSENNFINTVKKAAQTLGATTTIGNKKRILVAEDEYIGRTTIQLMLENDFVVEFAHNGKEAVDKVEKSPPDLVLMDIMMPIMNGFEAFDKIKALYGDKIPIVALTAKAMKSERNEIIAFGFDEYLSKPIDDEKLLSVIRRQLAKIG